jgi:hypothetical protein
MVVFLASLFVEVHIGGHTHQHVGLPMVCKTSDMYLNTWCLTHGLILDTHNVCFLRADADGWSCKRAALMVASHSQRCVRAFQRPASISDVGSENVAIILKWVILVRASGLGWEEKCHVIDIWVQVVHMCRVGQNHIYTVYVRHIWQGSPQIYGHTRCIYTIYGSGQPYKCALAG